MPRHYFNSLAAGVLAAALATSAPTSAASPPASAIVPAVRVQAARVRPGDALLVTVDGVPSSLASSTSGTVALDAAAREGSTSGTEPGEPRRLRFYPTPTGAQAITSLPVELEPGILRVEVRIPGRTDPLTASVEVVEPGFPEAKLSVAPKFIAPSPAQKKRMEEDQAAFREAFGRPFEPPAFAGPFVRPRDATVTGPFGERRTFNGKKQSQHYGTDLAGALGDPVRAANAGVVVLVRDCFASGKSIAIAHGGGLFSVYFHLSGFDVRHGDRVERGQVIGKVGATGRATGPHLH
ncbi:MAG: peptidoglycan DD-metalloendopeptidase family protein, partial [Anaeromyxobacteraceae bacterium]